MESFLAVVLFAFLMSQLHLNLKHMGFKRYALARALQHQLAWPRLFTYAKYWGLRFGMMLIPGLGNLYLMAMACGIVVVLDLVITLLGLINWVKWNRDIESIKG